MKSQATNPFTARIIRLDHGLRHHAVPVPEDIAQELKTVGARRLLATLKGEEYPRALQNHADGGSYIVLGKPLLKTLGLALGDTLTLSLRTDPQPEAVNIPEPLRLVLDQDPEALARWETFTPGRQRSLALYISSAKQENTQIKRAWELAAKIRTHSLYSDRK